MPSSLRSPEEVWSAGAGLRTQLLAHRRPRDFNATQSIRSIYYGRNERPETSTRGGQRQRCLTTETGAAPWARGLRGDVPSDRPAKRTKL